MKILNVALFTSFALACGSVALAQRSPSRNRVYNPTTETTIKGEIDQVAQVTRGRMTGTHVFVKAEGITWEVALGPAAFLDSKGFSFAKGDSVELTGSKVTISGKDYVIAREVIKDGKTLLLRDKNGIPVWAGPRRRRPTG